jgi:hypothetical protein
MAYVGAATSLVHEGRMRVPTAEWDRPDSTSALSLWPPGFPAAIALPVYFGASPIQSARWINVAAAAVSAGAIVVLVAGSVGTPAGIIAAAVVFATQAVFDTHISVLSEPLFIALTLLLLIVMVRARDQLLLMSVLATAVVMVRYAGVAAPAAAISWTLLDARRDFRTRMRRALAVALLPAIATVAWFARTAIAPDRHATPDLELYGGWGIALGQARHTIAQWLAPLLPDGPLQGIVALLVAIALATFIITAARDTAGSRWRRLRVGSVSTLLGATSLLGAWYVVVVVASRAFVGGTIPMDGRILAPLIVLIEVAAVAATGYWWRAYHFPLHATIAVMALIWFVAAATVTVNDAVYASTEGSDFAGRNWRQSPLIAWVRTHAVGRPVYTNWPPALYFHAHRIARELPDSTDPDDIAGFAERVRTNHGYVVGFNERSPDVMAPATLARDIGMHEVVRTADGAVWAADTGPTPDSATSDSARTDALRPDSARRISERWGSERRGSAPIAPAVPQLRR